MGKIVRHRDDSWAVIYIRVPGWLKNEVAKAAKKNKLSINAWAATILHQSLTNSLPEATIPPSPQEIVEGRIINSPAIEPCGEVAPCSLRTDGAYTVGDFQYCESCHIRVL